MYVPPALRRPTYSRFPPNSPAPPSRTCTHWAPWQTGLAKSQFPLTFSSQVMPILDKMLEEQQSQGVRWTPSKVGAASLVPARPGCCWIAGRGIAQLACTKISALCAAHVRRGGLARPRSSPKCCTQAVSQAWASVILGVPPAVVSPQLEGPARNLAIQPSFPCLTPADDCAAGAGDQPP